MSNQHHIESDGPIGDGPELRVARSILPAWFIERMMTDTWYFGLLLITGKVLAISCIDQVYLGVNIRSGSTRNYWKAPMFFRRKPYTMI